MSLTAKILIGVFVLAVIAAFVYMVASKKITNINPTTKGRPTPLATWNDWDWLQNGYTQAEIDAAKKATQIATGFNPFV